MSKGAQNLIVLAVLVLLVIIVAYGCAASVSCDKIPNPAFGDRLALGQEITADGPTSQKLLEQYDSVWEACGYK